MIGNLFQDENDQSKDQQSQSQQQQQQQSADKKEKKKKSHVKKIDLNIDTETHGLTKLQLDSFYEFEVCTF